jgi:hypothetical protein
MEILRIILYKFIFFFSQDLLYLTKKYKYIVLK